jgi:nucleoside-diphosphate-sugar epimerase
VRVAIVGATGNVGTSLVQCLVDDPEVTSIVGVARRLPSWQPAKTTWTQADMAIDDLAPVFEGADVVVHLAWIFQPTHDPHATWRTNVQGAIRVFDAAAAAGVGSLVYASSVGAYSPGPKDRAVDEHWRTDGDPTAAYSREKAYVERVLDAFESEHRAVRVVRMRPGFIFKRQSASEQRRLFAGPLLPNRLVRPGLVPFVPDVPGLRFQALHSEDAAQAYRLAVIRPVEGAFNLAADPVIGPSELGELLSARPVRVPRRVLRTAIAAAWHLHLVPASPHLFDLVLRVPVMATGRARRELGWSPTRSSFEAIEEFVEGLRRADGAPTPPLDPHAGGRFRQREVLTGVGQEASPRSE